MQINTECVRIQTHMRTYMHTRIHPHTHTRTHLLRELGYRAGMMSCRSTSDRWYTEYAARGTSAAAGGRKGENGISGRDGRQHKREHK